MTTGLAPKRGTESLATHYNLGQPLTCGWYPDLSEYKPVACECGHYMNCCFDDIADAKYFAIAFDPKGKLGWKSNVIEDSDPGYGGAMIIEMLTEHVDPRYLAYLEEKGLSYFFAGETEIDVTLALKILHDHLSPEFFVLEGGSIINGNFLRADCVDEISLLRTRIQSLSLWTVKFLILNSPKPSKRTVHS